MPTLNWIGKEKVQTHHLEVPYRVMEHGYGFTAENGDQFDPVESGNKIIYGDNLEALKSLLPFYEGKVDCIYIDPPYNTGNEQWVYNDNVNHPKIKRWLGQVVGKESEDLSRHDKWLCMMYPRLQLLKQLLSDTGVIFISIDDNEQANLKLICNEIFGETNFISENIVQSNSAKNNAKFISVTHEYLLVYAKKIDKVRPNWNVKKANVDEFSKRTNQLLKSNLTETEIKAELRQLTKYPRFFDFDHYLYVDKKGAFRASDLTAPNSQKFFDIIHPITGKSCKIGTRGWGFDEIQIEKLIEDDRILFGLDENTVPQLKNYLQDNLTQIPKSVLFFDTQNTTKWIKANKFNFDFPKPIELLEYLLSIVTDKNAIILDSFAGSGTTAHAVLNLNKKDGGNRKFILVELEDYANTITAERIKRVIKGYGEGNNAIEGTGGDFNFYTLGQSLLDDERNLNIEMPMDVVCSYIWYTETHTAYEKGEKSLPLLGVFENTAYYLNYIPNEVTTLDRQFLKNIDVKANQYVIYADNCLLPKELMQKYNIIFKKIPRDISQF